MRALEGEGPSGPPAQPPRLLLGHELSRLPLEDNLAALGLLTAPDLTATMALVFEDEQRLFVVEVRNGAVHVDEAAAAGVVALTATLRRDG